MTSISSQGQVSLPIALNWHFEPRCNYRCKFCFAHFADIEEKSDYPIDQLYADLYARGVRKITFVGGEPMLDRRIDHRITLAAAMGFTTCLVTNGTRVAPRWLEKLRDHLHWIGFSIDASNDILHAKIGRGRAGEIKAGYSKHLERSLVSWEAAKKLGYGLKLNTVVCQHNRNDNMCKLVARLKPDRWKVFQALPIKGENDHLWDELEGILRNIWKQSVPAEQRETGDHEIFDFRQRLNNLKLEDLPEKVQSKIKSSVGRSGNRNLDDALGNWKDTPRKLISAYIGHYLPPRGGVSASSKDLSLLFVKELQHLDDQSLIQFERELNSDYELARTNVDALIDDYISSGFTVMTLVKALTSKEVQEAYVSIARKMLWDTFKDKLSILRYGIQMKSMLRDIKRTWVTANKKEVKNWFVVHYPGAFSQMPTTGEASDPLSAIAKFLNETGRRKNKDEMASVAYPLGVGSIKDSLSRRAQRVAVILNGTITSVYRRDVGSSTFHDSKFGGHRPSSGFVRHAMDPPTPDLAASQEAYASAINRELVTGNDLKALRQHMMKSKGAGDYNEAFVDNWTPTALLVHPREWNTILNDLIRANITVSPGYEATGGSPDDWSQGIKAAYIIVKNLTNAINQNLGGTIYSFDDIENPLPQNWLLQEFKKVAEEVNQSQAGGQIDMNSLKLQERKMKITRKQLIRLIKETMVGYPDRPPFDLNKTQDKLTGRLRELDPFYDKDVNPEYKAQGRSLARTILDDEIEDEEEKIALGLYDKGIEYSDDPLLQEEHYVTPEEMLKGLIEALKVTSDFIWDAPMKGDNRPLEKIYKNTTLPESLYSIDAEFEVGFVDVTFRMIIGRDPDFEPKHRAPVHIEVYDEVYGTFIDSFSIGDKPHLTNLKGYTSPRMVAEEALAAMREWALAKYSPQ